MKNIYVIRPKGFNIGNEAIQIAVRHFLRSSFETEINMISIPATSKYESHGKAGFSSSTIYEINQFGDGVVVGGGNLYENGELEVSHQALKALNRPMMIFSVSRGRVYNSKLVLQDRTDVMSDQDIIALNKKAHLSLSRDEATHEYLQKIGCDQSVMATCPTLFMNEIPQHDVPLLKSTKTDVLISIRTPTLMSVPINYQYKLRGELVEMISKLQEQGFKNIKFLCHDHRDIPFAASFPNVGYLYTDDIYLYLSLLRATRLNITFRLHSFLPCLAFDIPTIKVSYDERALSLVKSIGLDDWNINYLKSDLVSEVLRRANNMVELTSLKEKLREDKWPTIKEDFVKYTRSFANMVNHGEK